MQNNNRFPEYNRRSRPPLRKLHKIGVRETSFQHAFIEVSGKTIDFPPTDSDDLARCKPVYMEMPGWKTCTEKARKFSDLPPKARAYVKKIAALTDTKLSIVSIGPARAQTIRL